MSRRRPSRTKKTCPTPWKSRWVAQEGAEDMLDEILSNTRHGLKTPRRSYRCPGCGYWHITSKE